MKTFFSLFLCALSFSGTLALPVQEDDSIYFSINTTSLAGGCDEIECSGPIQFYKELGCKPVLENPEDCCPYRYNCDNLKDRKNDKCYVNGNEYELGESLREDDAKPCDVGCTCYDAGAGASFSCAEVECFPEQPWQMGCYQLSTAINCCSRMICPEEPGIVPKCEVEGKTYEAGQYFSPSSEPKMDCYCSEGFTGEFKAPWCKVQSRSPCGIELRHAYEIDRKCAPVYYNGQSTQTGCPINYRCKNPKDQILRRELSEKQSSKSVIDSDDMKCQFGDIEMNLGDELNQGTYYSSVCVKCVCNVPPYPTCKQLPTDQCNRTEQFSALHNYSIA